MQLNPNTVKTLRQQYCWTQQHLVDASDVSLRTIERVMTTRASKNNRQR